MFFVHRAQITSIAIPSYRKRKLKLHTVIETGEITAQYFTDFFQPVVQCISVKKHFLCRLFCSFIAPYNFKGMEKLLKQYIDEEKLGMSSGEGFYKYNKKK